MNNKANCYEGIYSHMSIRFSVDFLNFCIIYTIFILPPAQLWSYNPKPFLCMQNVSLVVIP